MLPEKLLRRYCTIKNEVFFPIDANKMTIAVIGENATRSMTVGGGSSELKAN
jgi:beta-glucosidase